MKLYSLKELATRDGISYETAHFHAKRIGIQMVGKVYVLTEDDWKRVLESKKSCKSGRPFQKK